MSIIPNACGGSVSDRIFVERSTLPEMYARHDSIMVDKGFDVRNILHVEISP